MGVCEKRLDRPIAECRMVRSQQAQKMFVVQSLVSASRRRRSERADRNVDEALLEFGIERAIRKLCCRDVDVRGFGPNRCGDLWQVDRGEVVEAAESCRTQNRPVATSCSCSLTSDTPTAAHTTSTGQWGSSLKLRDSGVTWAKRSASLATVCFLLRQVIRRSRAGTRSQ